MDVENKFDWEEDETEKRSVKDKYQQESLNWDKICGRGGLTLPDPPQTCRWADVGINLDFLACVLQTTCRSARTSTRLKRSLCGRAELLLPSTTSVTQTCCFSLSTWVLKPCFKLRNRASNYAQRFFSVQRWQRQPQVSAATLFVDHCIGLFLFVVLSQHTSFWQAQRRANTELPQ